MHPERRKHVQGWHITNSHVLREQEKVLSCRRMLYSDQRPHAGQHVCCTTCGANTHKDSTPARAEGTREPRAAASHRVARRCHPGPGRHPRPRDLAPTLQPSACPAGLNGRSEAPPQDIQPPVRAGKELINAAAPCVRPVCSVNAPATSACTCACACAHVCTCACACACVPVPVLSPCTMHHTHGTPTKTKKRCTVHSPNVKPKLASTSLDLIDVRTHVHDHVHDSTVCLFRLTPCSTWAQQTSPSTRLCFLAQNVPTSLPSIGRSAGICGCLQCWWRTGASTHRT